MLSSNPNITLKIINENLDKPWNYSNLSSNKFTKMRLEFIHEKIKEYFKNNVIIEMYKILYHPSNYLYLKNLRLIE